MGRVVPILLSVARFLSQVLDLLPDAGREPGVSQARSPLSMTVNLLTCRRGKP